MEEYIAIVNKPIPIDTLREKQVKKFRIESPIGAVESDSGNHLVDVGSVLIVILIFFGARKFFKAT